MRVRFRPLQWVGPQTPPHERRSRDTYSTPWHQTVDLLVRELKFLGADEFVIEADFHGSEIGLDGFPQPNAHEPEFPGIRITFESKHGPLVYQTDACDRWQHNVLSIALGLAALRTVDRHGITRRAEQYIGFSTLGCDPGTPPGGHQHFADAVSALRWLHDPEVCGLRGAEGAATKSVLRLVARRTHPDHGGTREQWDKYQEARRLLDAEGMI